MNRYLILGNGFDLAHRLPTSYRDFLYVCAEYASKKHNIIVNDPIIEEVKKSFMYKYFNDLNMKKMILNNSWLKLFYYKYNYIGLNWIDFEKEIKNTCYNYFEADEQSTQYVLTLYENTFVSLDQAKEDLKDLVYLLNRYLLIVNEVKINLYFPDIINFLPTHIINFNYTNTFGRVYFDQVKTDFIHGEINSNDKSSIVLGFEAMEYESEDILFSEFLKYIQIVKNDVIIDSYTEMQKNEENESTFFGHSLDETDKDLICKIISCSKRVNILYKDDEMKNNIILNLIKIYGRDDFIKLTSSGERKIYFTKQCDPLEGNLSEINYIFDVCLNKNYKYMFDERNISFFEKYNIGLIPIINLVDNMYSNYRIAKSKKSFLEKLESYVSKIEDYKYCSKEDKSDLIKSIKDFIISY